VSCCYCRSVAVVAEAVAVVVAAVGFQGII
jgi:hypothetical protein